MAIIDACREVVRAKSDSQKGWADSVGRALGVLRERVGSGMGSKVSHVALARCQGQFVYASIGILVSKQEFLNLYFAKACAQARRTSGQRKGFICLVCVVHRAARNLFPSFARHVLKICG